MTPIKRSKIHEGNCPHCNNGTGQKNQDKREDSINTGWSEGFDTYEEAKTAQQREYPDFTESGPCLHCKPHINKA